MPLVINKKRCSSSAISEKNKMKETPIELQASNGAIEVLRAGEEIDRGSRGFYAPSTITLFKRLLFPSGNYLGIVDTGSYGETELVRGLLADQLINPKLVRRVYLTHNHPDHQGNVHLFEKAFVFGPDSSYRLSRPNYFKNLAPPESMTTPGFLMEERRTPSAKLQVISTPGHTGQDLSLVYQCRNGLVAVVGDLFWSQHDWESDSEFTGLCVNQELQKRSRDYIRGLRPAVVIPGHGPAFAPIY
jgi:glyoxylase-like metal-dependent hydrolase (beta-lactamase superfamily II)